jgi:hypothetical protein
MSRIGTGSPGALPAAGPPADRSGNVANRKGFRLVLQCQNVAEFELMSNLDEAALPRGTRAAPTAIPPAADADIATAPPSGSPGPTRDVPAHLTDDSAGAASAVPRPREIGGRDGPEPTRYGDWERAGRCIDF